MMDVRSQIRAGLLSRGMAPHVADAFILNFQDESGLSPGINEISPIVPGSRGGFGLAQWTGPRRRQLEQFAQSRGAPVSDLDTQLDFLMSELQGSESRAAQSIFSAQDTGSAAAAIVNNFLRPAEEHRARRVAKYTGGSQDIADATMATLGKPPMRPQGILSTNSPQTEAPMEPEKATGLFGALFPNMTADRQDRLAVALSGLSMHPNQGVVQMAGQRMADRRDDRKEAKTQAKQAQRTNATLQWLQTQAPNNPNAAQALQMLSQGVIDAQGALQLALQKPERQDPTALMQNVEYIMQQNPGMPFEQALQAARSGQTINVNGQAPSPATGYRNVFDDQGRLVAQEPIPGGPVDTEQRQSRQAQEQANQAQQTQQQTTDNVVLNQVNAIRGMLNNGGMFDLPEVGIVGNALGRLGVNQEAVNMRNRLATLEGMVSFDQLARMREASPTGGALGAISERELMLLSAQLGTLDQSSDPQTIMETLDLLETVMRKADAYPNASQFGFGGSAPANAPRVRTYNPQTGRLE